MKTINIKYFFTFPLIALLLLTCWSCAKKDISYSTTTKLESFAKIELHSTFHVHLIEDTVFSVRAIGRQDVVEGLIFTISDSTLKIEDPRRSEWRTPRSNKVELHISAPPLKELTTFEACDIKSTTPITSEEFGLILGGKANEASLQLNCGTFYYWSGSVSGGKIILTGATNTLKLWNTGLVQIDAHELNTNYALVENKSRGNCEVKVSTKLDYAVLNSGDIIVYDSPEEVIEMDSDESATGKLILK